MNIIFAKLFEGYEAAKETPEISIVYYISFFYFLLSFNILLPLKIYVEKIVYNDKVALSLSIIAISVIGLYATIIYGVNYIFIKKRFIYKLKKKHKNKRIPKIILYPIIVITPILLLLLAGIITVYLNGGIMFGNEIQGVFEK